MLKSRTFVIFSLLIFMLVALSGCDLAVSLLNSEQDEGHLKLQISESNVKSRTLLPDITMDISSYTIRGSGPDGETFTEALTDSTTFTKADLAKGSWNITVEAYNAGTDSNDPVLIGEGEKTVTILPAVLNEEEVTVTPVIGTGAFELTANWDETLTDPSLTYTLTTASGIAVTTPETFIISGQSGILNIPSLDNGYYVLEVTLKESDSPVGYAADTLRIVSGETTSGTLAMSLDDTGDFELSITPQMDDPLSIELTGGEETLTLGSDMTITATPSETVDSYAWYLNGLKLTGETASSITLGSDLPEGDYTLMSMVWKGNVVCSESYIFQLNAVQLEDDFNDGDYTNGVAWTLWNEDDHPASLITSNDYVEIKRTNAGGNGGIIYLEYEKDISIDEDTLVEFDVNPVFSDVGDGAGWNGNEYPIWISLYLTDQDNVEHRLQFAYNYRGGSDSYSDEFIRIAYPYCTQNVWIRNEQFVIRDYFPTANKITKVLIGGSGWNFEGYADNITISN